jgi:hypothetical protein
MIKGGNIMPTFARALRVKRGMEAGTGAHYRIWADPKYDCYRVLPFCTYREGLVLLEDQGE